MPEYKRWVSNGDFYRPVGEICTEGLPPGFYHVGEDGWTNEPVLKRVRMPKDKLQIYHPHVLDEIDQFWNAGERYAAMGVTHKRSILLYGPPGTGKTSLLRNIVKRHRATGGYAFKVTPHDDPFVSLPKIKPALEGRQVILIMEDIDGWHEPELVNLLDGDTNVGAGVLFLSTTNYLDKLSDRIKKRPSRIDTLMLIGYPSREDAAHYIESLGGDPDWADEAPEFTFAELKELVIAVRIYDRGLEESVRRIKHGEVTDAIAATAD